MDVHRKEVSELSKPNTIESDRPSSPVLQVFSAPYPAM